MGSFEKKRSPKFEKNRSPKCSTFVAINIFITRLPGNVLFSLDGFQSLASYLWNSTWPYLVPYISINMTWEHSLISAIYDEQVSYLPGATWYHRLLPVHSTSTCSWYHRTCWWWPFVVQVPGTWYQVLNKTGLWSEDTVPCIMTHLIHWSKSPVLQYHWYCCM